MSKRVKLMLLAATAIIGLIAALSWFGVQQAREQERFDKAVVAAGRAADAGAAGKPLCARAVAVIEPALQKSAAVLTDNRTIAAYRALGECQMLLERFDFAEKAFAAVVEGQPQQARAHADLARALSKLGRHHEAVRSAALSAQLAPHIWQSHRVLGIVLSSSGRTDEAIAAFEKARSMAPATEKAAADRAIARLKSEKRPVSPEIRQ